MDVATRNTLNINSRWKKIQYAEAQYIDLHAWKYPHLKARILGFLAGDGNIYIGTNGHHTARFFPDHISLLYPFCEAFGKIYGKLPLIKRLPNMYHLTVDSKIVVNDIIKHAKFGVKKWRVPNSVLLDKQSKIEWLRAFFDCEAYVANDCIKIQTVNEIGMTELKELLGCFGIESKQYTYVPKNEKWSTNHIIVINNINKIKYLNEIGFNHSIKAKKLEETLKIYK